jgi:hypothetical protein
LSFGFPVLASEFEFTIALGEDLELAPGETISWGDIANGRVQPHGVVMVNEALDKSSGILLGERAARPETIGFEALVPSLDFTVALRVVRRGFDMGQPGSVRRSKNIIRWRLIFVRRLLCAPAWRWTSCIVGQPSIQLKKLGQKLCAASTTPITHAASP